MSLLELARSRYQELLASAGNMEHELRRQAWMRAEELGLPDRKHELWKYSPVAKWFGGEWTSPSTRMVSSELREVRDRYREHFDVLVAVNGHLLLEESAVQGKPAWTVQNKVFKGPLEFEDGVGYLTAAAAPGWTIEVPAGVRVERPLLLLQWGGDTHSWMLAQYGIYLNEGAQLSLLEWKLGAPEVRLRSEVMAVHCEKRAQINWVQWIEESPLTRVFSDTQIGLCEGSSLQLTQIHRSSSWWRNQTRAYLRGQEAAAHLQGLTFARDQQQVDQRVVANHLAEKSVSSQLFKGVLKDRSRASMNGKIYFAPGAQKVSSHQVNHNLLMSPLAEVNSKPELEIYADDVKANHGATMGRLDDDKVFYLQSRGLKREAAERLLSSAYVMDIVMKIEDSRLRRWVEDRI